MACQYFCSIIIRKNTDTKASNFVLLLGAHRISAVKLYSMPNMVLNDLSVTFIATEVLTHSRKGKPLDKLKYRSYTDTSSLSHSKRHLKGH